MRASVAALLLAGVLSAPPAQAQAPDGAGDADAGPRVRATATAGISLRDGPAGFRFGQDVRAVALRLQLARASGLEPWLEASGFRRVDFDCARFGDDPCNDEGVTARVGASAVFGASGSGGGPLQGELLAGVGAGFSAETTWSYVFGLEVQWAQWPGILPVVGIRYERYPGLTNVAMAHGGIRIEL